MFGIRKVSTMYINLRCRCLLYGSVIRCREEMFRSSRCFCGVFDGKRTQKWPAEIPAVNVLRPPISLYPSTNARSFFNTADRGNVKAAINEPSFDNASDDKLFIKNLFLGKCDVAMLKFPEILSNLQFEELNQMSQTVENFFAGKLDSASIDKTANIPDEVMKILKSLGLFGQQIPVEYGGLGLNATQYARLSEVTSSDGSVHLTLSAHQDMGLKGILMVGTDEQKKKYLPKLATGENIAAFCLTEPGSGSDFGSIKTKATLSEDGKTYYLNGSKAFVSNGAIADLMTVFAKTELTDSSGKRQEKITAFIVEKTFAGIKFGEIEDNIGARGSNMCSIHFDSTPVQKANILGEIGGGFKLANDILSARRYTMGASCAGIVKKLISLCAEHSSTRKQFEKHLNEYELVHEKFVKMAVATYAMESVAFFTAGIIDSFPGADMSLESAAVNVFSSESCCYCVNEALQIVGGLGYMKGYPYERYLRECRTMLLLGGTNDILRLYIALSGLQHAGTLRRETVKKIRNPLNNVGFVLRRAREKIQRSSNVQHRLYDNVDISLSQLAERLEMTLWKFHRIVENYLAKYGDSIIEEQMALKRFADVVIEVFVTTSVLARCSRSLSLNLDTAVKESRLAKLFCLDALDRIDNNVEMLYLGRIENKDDNYSKLANDIFKRKGYAASHALDRNW